MIATEQIERTEATRAAVRELEKLVRANGGTVTPEAVVEAAEPSESPLHGFFTWDDSEAAIKWRVHQARNLLIRCRVEFKTRGEPVNVRAFVSLTTERGEEGGYRMVKTVMSDRALRLQLLADAMAEMESFQQKYAALSELAEVFAAMKRARKVA